MRTLPVALALSAVAATLSYWHTREVAQDGDRTLLIREAQRALSDSSADRPGEASPALPDQVARRLIGGSFIVAQAYSSSGEMLVESVRPGYETVPQTLASLSHVTPTVAAARDQPMVMGRQALRIVVPTTSMLGAAAGHLEAIYVVRDEDVARYRDGATMAAIIAAMAVLLCAAALAPLMTTLTQRQYRWACSLLGAHLSILEAFGRAIARRDSDTGLHNYRVSWIAARIGEEAGLSAPQLRNLIAGAFLHDVGKIGVPDAILLKPGPLDAREREMMQAHVEIGTYIVGSVGFLGARDVIAGHHEKWDGTGYPHHLAGEAIPVAARIFCIADVYDALRAKRPYKPAYDLARTMDIMRVERGKHFDPALLAIFERLVAECEAKVINADEEQVIELMRQMTERHFFGSGAAMAHEGWSGQGCGEPQGPASTRIGRASDQVGATARNGATDDCCRPETQTKE